MTILGIETSCDETAAGILDLEGNILSNVVASQIETHAPYGGIIPELASRAHIVNIHKVVNEALKIAKISVNELSAIAVTNGPGLAGSLLVGLNFAKGLSASLEVPLIGVNHLEGHISACFIEENKFNYSLNDVFPCIALLISGGHTELILMNDYDSYKLLGQTRDDAVGEAFDKVSRILGLGYPGGPVIEKWAKLANKQNYVLPRSWLKKDEEFSFSGLKTASKNLAFEKIYSNNKLSNDDIKNEISEVAYAFQISVSDVLINKSIRIAEKYNCKNILVSGGVAANGFIRENFKNTKINSIFPERKHCTDNGLMIACRGLIDYKKNKFINPQDINVAPQLNVN
jgi:N6-L-threonylcarbamoyladenine synthase